jgi:hypothetical protein
VLHDPDNKFSEHLREVHVMPPRDDPAAAKISTTLEWRRRRLSTMEAEFIKKIGLQPNDE